jgi:hypothetical protein
MTAPAVIAVSRSKTLRTVILVAGLLVVFTPVLVVGGAVSVLSQSAQACTTAGEVEQPAGGGPAAAGLFAQPLHLQPGRWYEVGATRYGGPEDPTSGEYGAIPDPSESYLPDHPDSYAELSVLSTNPANHGTFTFADANALDNLPYMTGLRVVSGVRQEVLYKRDIGYGQGPGQTIANGEPYRLDLWWQAAQNLDVSKGAVRIQLAPASGTANTLGQSTSAEETGATSTSGSGGSEECGGSPGAGEAPLPLVPGDRTTILPSGLAAAGREAPTAVKDMVAAGNRLYGTAYLYGGGHGPSLNTLQSAYDCSSAVSYVLHAGGALGSSALDSTELASYGLPGPGRYVTIYANAAHAFMYVGGLRFDTVEAPEYDTGPNSGKPGARWRVYPSVPAWATWTVRHPAGL